MLAANPPMDDGGICATLWDLASPDWRKPRPAMRPLTREQHDEIVRQSKGMRAAALAGPPAGLPRRGEDIQHRPVHSEDARQLADVLRRG